MVDAPETPYREIWVLVVFLHLDCFFRHLLFSLNLQRHLFSVMSPNAGKKKCYSYSLTLIN